MRSTHADTSARDALAVSKNLLRSSVDLFELPSAVFKTTDAIALLNLAEGNGKRNSSIERRRFFEISMGSIAEVMACVDLAHVFGLIKDVPSLKSRLKLAYVKISALP